MEYKFTDGLTADARLIRESVFIKEQGFENEFDGIDSLAVHVVVYENGSCAATGRLFKGDSDGTMIIGRVATLSEYRRRGFGGGVISALEDKAREAGAKRIELSAQVRAKGFYESLGYASTGELSDDEGVPHVKMIKLL